MEKIMRWWMEEGKKCQEKRYVTLVKSLLLAMLPLLCCLVYCGMRGHILGEVYLPSSPWNDELFYYKQIDGIIHYGYPQGYFGYNESHALKLSFAAWSPVLVFPWILWGLVFGWNLMSPIICNIVFMTLCCFLFVWLTRPTWKQLGVLSVLFCLFTPFARYMLSVMPEIICFSMLIMFYGMAVNYLRWEKLYKLVLLFVLSGIMTLMRPYLALFMLLPAYFWVRRDKNHVCRWVGVVGSALILGTVFGLYVCIMYYCGAEYFEPWFHTEWILVYFKKGILAGIRNTLQILHYKGNVCLTHIQQGFQDGLASGAFFAGHVICICVLVAQSFLDWWKLRRLERPLDNDGKAAERLSAEEQRAENRKGEERKRLMDQMIVEAHLAFSSVIILFALLLMYKLTEGSKHLLTFMAAAIFVIALMETKFYKKAVVVGIAFVYFYSYMAVEPYDYEAPFMQEERVASVKAFEESAAGQLTLEHKGVPNYENVIIWVFNDKVDGVDKNTTWQLMYGLPAGFGISCCMRDYVIENFGDLKSRYLLSPAGGEIDALCREAGYRLLYEDSQVVFYKRTDM